MNEPRWKPVYAAILIINAVLIVFFYVLMSTFA